MMEGFEVAGRGEDLVEASWRADVGGLGPRGLGRWGCGRVGWVEADWWTRREGWGR
jgi:hypothetical protein